MLDVAGPDLAVRVLVAALAVGIAALAALVITPRVTRFATRRSYHALPTGDRRIHERPTPWLGGAAVVLAMLTSLLITGLVVGDVGGFRGHERHLVGIFAGAGVLFVVGLADDFVEFRAQWTAIAQLVAAICIVSADMAIETVSLGGGTVLTLGALSVPITILWIMGVTNAFNLIDGLDGLATGLGFIALTATAIGATLLGNLAVLALSATLAGALLGFLRFNYNPAKIFLGNAGSFVVGFLLAVLSMHGSVAGDDAGMLILVPLAALALPLLDTSLAIVRRWLRGVPIFAGDARHVHHRLLHIGLTQRGAVHVLWLVAAAFATLGLVIAFTPEPARTVAAGVGGVGALAGGIWSLHRLEYSELIVAARLVTRAPLSFRQAVRHQIHAEDMTGPLRASETLEQVNAILADNAGHFGFQRLVVRRERDRWLDGWVAPVDDRTRQLDFPLESQATNGDSLVLHIRGGDGPAFQADSGEQIADVLVPVLENWIIRVGHPTNGARANGVAANGVAANGVAEPDPSGNGAADGATDGLRGTDGPTSDRPGVFDGSRRRASTRRHYRIG